MDALTFISSVVGNLIWPIVVVGFGTYSIFNLDRFARAFKSIKVKDVEINFRDDIEQLKDDAMLAMVTLAYPASQLLHQNFLASPDSNRIAIIEAGNEVEGLLRDWSKRQVGGPKNYDSAAILKQMKRIGAIDDELLLLIQRVLGIRNKAVHAPEVSLTPGELLEFLGVARSVKSRLKILIQNLPDVITSGR